MTQKLTRNLSDPRWREFWKGVEAAAARAKPLRYLENEPLDPPKKSVRSKRASKARAK